MDKYFISHGAHSEREEGMCAMEWVAFLAGEEHTDSPRCVSDLLINFTTTLNDSLDSSERQRLKPYLVRMIGTRYDGKDKERAEILRAYAAEKTPDEDGCCCLSCARELALEDENENAPFELLDKMLPLEPIQLPTVEEALPILEYEPAI